MPQANKIDLEKKLKKRFSLAPSTMIKHLFYTKSTKTNVKCSEKFQRTGKRANNNAKT